MKVFISHSSHDKWVARQISGLLEKDGHSTFLDEKDIRTGESIDASIQKHLKDSDHLLILITPASLTSHWVFVELGGAKALGKRVIPILMHVGANELPGPINNLLAREINDFDKYLSEIKTPTGKSRKVIGTAKAPDRTKVSERPKVPKSSSKHVGGFSVGEEVRVASVEHLTEEDKAKFPRWVAAMDKYSGVVTTITGFSAAGHAFLEASGDRYRWNLGWLTKAA